MRSSRAALAACALLALVCSAAAVTTRSATVDVVNNSGQKVLAGTLNVMHKYSDNFKNGYVYLDALENGERTKPNRWSRTWQTPPMGDTGAATVQYNTGFATTGVDWWQVSWSSTPDYVLHTSNPENGRAFFDLLEQGAPKLIALATTAAVAAASEGTAAATAENAGTAVSLLIANTLLNTESTDGFKRCFLTSDDENQPVVVTLTSPATLNIAPASSSSCDTGTTNQPLDAAAIRAAVAASASKTSTEAATPGVADDARPVELEFRNLGTGPIIDVIGEFVQSGKPQTTQAQRTPLQKPGVPEYVSPASPVTLGSGPFSVIVAFAATKEDDGDQAIRAFATDAGPGVCAIAAPGLAGAVTARMNDVTKKMLRAGPMVNCGFPVAADCKSIADPKWRALRTVGLYAAVDAARDGCGTFACNLAPGDNKLVVKVYDSEVKVQAYPSRTYCPKIGVSEIVAPP